MWPACRTPLSTASRIPPFIRTGASHLHDAAALRSERFWSAEKTNAGESKLRSHSQAWPRRGSSLGPGHKEERLPQLFPVTSESAHSAPSVKPVHSTAEFTLTCPPCPNHRSQLLCRKVMTQGPLPSRLLLEELHRRYAHSRSSRP